uniref:Uncharacterized protein n=1 Tax=Anguilla anguilla TaxID=7936 RepID=A0A0E9QTV6_ANGAN
MNKQSIFFFYFWF